jgi:predicted Zn finger-like uncharacterized protein
MRIQCPECRQRFDVTEEFVGKTVECGSCEHRFEVSEEVEVREKAKFYPGEKRQSLERFARTRSSVVASSDKAKAVGFKQAHYQPDVDASQIGPPRHRRTMAAILGVSLMVLVMIVFLLAGGKEGAMRDMETPNRFVLVGFTAVLGCLLVFYGMVKNRVQAALLCLVLGGGLLVLPMVFPGNPTSASVESHGMDFQPKKQASELGGKKISKEDYLFEIGYMPVAEALQKYKSESVVAVYVRGANQLVRDKIVEYLYDETGRLNRGVAYNRRGGVDDSDLYGLIVMVKQKVTIDEIALMCSRFGRVNKIHRDIRVIDVTAEREKISKLDPDETSELNPESPEFYKLQLEGLQNFDPEVKMKAVKRLAILEPKVLRDDITKALVKLLPMSDSELQLELINTLSIWSKPGDGADAEVFKAVQNLHAKGKVSETAMAFLVDRKVDGIEVILMDLWNAAPVVWSDLLMKLGEGAQVLLLPHLGEMDTEHLVSAADILGKVGSKSCVTHLEQVMEKQESAGKKSLQAAIDEIKNRP